MKRNIVLAALVLTALIIGCNSKGEKSKKDGEPMRDERFAIYLLSDPSINAVTALRRDLNTLQLSDSSLITASDLEAYYWNEHVIIFAKGKVLMITVEDVGSHGLPFVVPAKGKRIYLGAFWTRLSSVSFPAPVIFVNHSAWQSYVSGVYAIKRAYPADDFAEGPDPRGDPLIRAVLEEAGKINLGGIDSLVKEELEEGGRLDQR